MSLEHLIVPKSKEVLKKKKKNRKEGCQRKEYKSQTEIAPNSHKGNNMSNKISNIVLILAYNPRYEINSQ